MLTVLELSDLTGKASSVIRYWLKKDTEFVRLFWTKKRLKIKNIKGIVYEKDMYTCDEADAVKIIEYIKNKRKQKAIDKWTDIAIHCYKRNMLCKGCCFDKYCSEFTNPPLKDKVQEFVRLYGEPR